MVDVSHPGMILVKRKRGRPARPQEPGPLFLYERGETVGAVQRVLDGLEIPDVDAAVRLTLQRILWRRDYFHKDGAGHITLLLRTILETEGNGIAALVEPVVSAVAAAMRPEWTEKGLGWLESFDSIPLLSLLESMKSLQIFKQDSLRTYLGYAVRNRLWSTFGPDPVAQPAPKVKARRRGPTPAPGKPKRQAERPAARMAA